MSWTDRIVAHRRGVLLAWTVFAAATVPLARDVEDRLETDVHVPDSQSAQVDDLLMHSFASPFARFAVLVVRGAPPVASPEGQAALRRVVASVADAPAVTGTLSAADTDDPLFVGDDGATFVLVGLDPAARVDQILPDLRARTAEIEGLELLWTGAGPLTVDLRRASADDARTAERRILPLVLVMLVIAFGALAAALLPIAAGALSIVMTLGAVDLMTRLLPLSILVVNVTTMLGLGLGIDYALLLVSRFREARGNGLTSPAAAREAGRHAGETILLSGGAVLLGFIGLLLVPLSDMRSMAIGGILVTIFSALVATTLLPALLASSGNRVATVRSRPAGSDRWWQGWSLMIVERPVRVLLIAGAALGALAWPARRLERHMPSGAWLPPGMEAARGLAAMEEMGRGGIVQVLRVVVELPEGESVLTAAGWAATARVAERLGADPRVAGVRSLPTLVGRSTPPPPLLLAMVPEVVMATYVGEDGRRALIEVLPAAAESPEVAMDLVRELRRQGGLELSGRADVRVLVGGLPAFNADYEDVIRAATPRVLFLVLAGTFIALAIGFGSVLVPLKAIALNLLTVGAAFGLVVAVFQDGHGLHLIGLASPLDSVFASVPLLVFCTVFGLSMDYEVFLVARVAEATRAGMGTATAVVEGVRRTGGVITSAGLVMIIVFGAFVLSDFVLMKLLGFALAAVVLIDITLVRLALGPALLVLAGRWNWWPGLPIRRQQVGGEVRELPAG